MSSKKRERSSDRISGLYFPFGVQDHGYSFTENRDGAIKLTRRYSSSSVDRIEKLELPVQPLFVIIHTMLLCISLLAVRAVP